MIIVPQALPFWIWAAFDLVQASAREPSLLPLWTKSTYDCLQVWDLLPLLDSMLESLVHLKVITRHLRRRLVNHMVIRIR